MSGVRVSDSELSAYMDGLLEPHRALEVSELVDALPSLQRRLAGLRRPLSTRRARPRRWYLPPPGLAVGRRPVQGQVRTGVFGETLRPGDAFEVALTGVVEPERKRVRVLLWLDGDWQVVFPSRPEEELTADRLEQGADGERIVELVADQAPPVQRWAVVLDPTDAAVDWSAGNDERWQHLLEAVETGEASVSVVEVVLQAPVD